MTRLLVRVTESQPRWGGLVIDEKGDWTPIVQQVLAHRGRRADVRILGPGTGEAHLNPLLDRRFTASALARSLSRAASAVCGTGGEQAFFTAQAQARLTDMIDLLRAAQDGLPGSPDTQPSVRLALDLLGSEDAYRDWLHRIGALEGTAPQIVTALAQRLRDQFWHLPSETLGGIQATLTNQLGFLAREPLHTVFGQPGGLRIDACETGAVLVLGLPQSLALERRFAAAWLKSLFYQLARQRFDRRDQRTLPLLLLWQDEAQRFIQEEDGDVDILRGASATTVLACQSIASLQAALGGREKAEPILLNLRNRIIFRSSDEACAATSADFLGKRTATRRTHTRGGSGESTSFARETEHQVPPHRLRSLPDFTAILAPAVGPWRPVRLAPIEPDGTTPGWWKKREPWHERFRRALGIPAEERRLRWRADR